MRALLPLLALAIVSACVAPQAGAPVPRPPLSASAAPSGSAKGPLIGQTAAGLAALFGTPKQEAREMEARRLQWSNGRCVLDAYLYPQRSGDRRVTYVDARTPTGDPVDAEACAATLRAR